MGIKYADFSPVYGMSGVHGMLSPSVDTENSLQSMQRY